MDQVKDGKKADCIELNGVKLFNFDDLSLHVNMYTEQITSIIKYIQQDDTTGVQLYNSLDGILTIADSLLKFVEEEAEDYCQFENELCQKALRKKGGEKNGMS